MQEQATTISLMRRSDRRIDDHALLGEIMRRGQVLHLAMYRESQPLPATPQL